MEALNEKQYSSDQCKAWTEQIGSSIKTKLKGMYEISHKLLYKHVGLHLEGNLKSMVCYFFSLLLAELNLERYKFVVQVVIGEQRGEGVK